MKKEVFLAIAIGFALGLVITFGIWTANKSLAGLNKGVPAQPTLAVNTSPSTSPTPTPAGNALLTVNSPTDELLTNKNTVTVSGKTFASGTVVITYESDEQIIVADASGNFSYDVTLIAGYNQITVTAFDQNGQTATQSLTVTYSTAVI